MLFRSCGMLDHGEKDCPERKDGENYGDEERKQYDAWLRGEPGRSSGRDYGRMGNGLVPENRDDLRETGTETQTRARNRLKESSVVGRQHVSEQVVGQGDGTRNIQVEQGEGSQKVESFQSGETFHGNGKVSTPESKVDDKLTKSGKDPLMNTPKAKDLEDKMQCEEVMCDVANLKPEEGRSCKQETKGSVCADKEKQNWAESVSSPLAMSYDQERGWTSEMLGPKSGHWKRLARQVKECGPTVVSDPASQKRKGEAPLIELVQNAKCTKRAKGKEHTEKVLGEEMKMVGGVAVTAMQHRPAK